MTFTLQNDALFLAFGYIDIELGYPKVVPSYFVPLSSSC